jgi:NADPH:quinone reductase
MKAMIIETKADLGKLAWQEVPIPDPGPRDLLVKVKAASVNRADLLQLQGKYHSSASSPGSSVAGLEAAGEVVDAGKAVTGFKVGDRVAGLCTGGYAQYAILDARLAIPVPERLEWHEAGAFALGYMTQYNAMVTNARITAGQSVMITAASSGVGVAGIQLARFFGGAPLIGTTGTPGKSAALHALGIDRVIDYRTENIADAARQATGGVGVDVIVDHVGGAYLADHLRALAVKGRLISVGRLGQAVGEIDMELLALNRLRVIGVTFRTRTLEERIAIVRGVIDDLLPGLADGRLQPVVDKVFPLEKAVEAQDYMRSNRQIGKIVLKLD